MPKTLPPPVSALEARLRVPAGSLAGTDLLAAQEALSDVTGLVLAEVPAAIATKWETDAPSVVYTVALKAARREYENPNGYTDESLGEHSAGILEENATGAYLTDREAAMVRRAAGLPDRRARGFVGTIRTPSAYEEDKP